MAKKIESGSTAFGAVNALTGLYSNWFFYFLWIYCSPLTFVPIVFGGPKKDQVKTQMLLF